MKLDSTNQILLGEPLARDLGVKVGDTVSIMTERPGYGGIDTAMLPKDLGISR